MGSDVGFVSHGCCIEHQFIEKIFVDTFHLLKYCEEITAF